MRPTIADPYEQLAFNFDPPPVKPCVKCGATDRYGSGDCRACARKRDRKYREANKPRIAERDRKYYEANKERMNERTRKYHQANKPRRREYEKNNKPRIAEYGRKYYEANKERMNERGREYNQANKPRIAEYGREYNQANPEVARRANAKRRARKAGVLSEPYDFEAIKAKHNYRCLCCGKHESEIDGVLHRDHVVPLSWADRPEYKESCTDTAANIQPLCGTCNLSKGAHHATDYRKGKL